MSSLFRLQLLGPVSLYRDGEPIHGFKSRKVLALLGYLAAEGRPISRSYLAELFWPDQPESRSRNNLSQALHNLLNLWPGCCEANHHAIRFCSTASTSLDLKGFNDWVGKGEVSTLAMAAELYRGDFMAGMYLDNCPEFEQWLRLEQENWRQRVTQVLRDLIAHYTQPNETEQALQFISRLLEIDPGDEDAHRQKIVWLAQSGQRSASLAQFEACRLYLTEELGVEPASETVQLYERIRSGELRHEAQISTANGNLSSAVSTPASFFYNNLPAQSTSFIGREEELTLIEQYLGKPACRLLTIIGLGGIGKTRLALQSAAAANGFRQGVCFVGLTSISSPDFLISTIASALKFPLYGRGDPKTQLIDYLSDKEMLLVLDNFEHLISGAGLLVEILQRAPHLKMLVTSRERLSLQEEWILDLQGLTFPEGDDMVLLENYSAVQLFLQRAQQVQADFWLRYLDKPAVVRICRLVEGMPLGIELAAAWIRTFSCREIVVEIEKTTIF
ncbi:MAG: hypothetical protein HC875_06880 [Anaerolineales bacterium]|nr:hypothetical protein [Anaerolineales bacterium]